MEILLGIEARDLDIIVLLVEYFNVDESLPRHDRLHEAEIEAPDHDDAQNHSQWRHYNPVLNVR